MKTRMLIALLRLVAAAESAAGSPPATDLPSKSRVNRSVSTDTDELRVNVIGREIEIHRADPATSASELHAQQRNSVTVLKSNASFTRPLALVYDNHSLTAATVPSQLERALAYVIS